MASVIEETRCCGCGATLGERHSPDCPEAICWHCARHPRECDLSEAWRPEPYPWAGNLEWVFAAHNRHYHGMDLDEQDYWPFYEGGKLVGLRANRVGPGAWHVIETSKQARDLIDLTFAMPHLSLQTVEDCIHALLRSPLLPHLHVLQLGDTWRGWGATMDDDGASCEGEDTDALVRLIERAPRVRELYLAVLVPEPNRLLAALFPPLLEVLQVRNDKPFNLGVLARNESLQGLSTLILHQDRGDDSLQPDFHEQFAALVNAPGLAQVDGLRIDIPQVDDACCASLVTSGMLKHLKDLWLEGGGITDAGAEVLAASPEVRSLDELRIGSRALTERGYDALRAAGVNVQRPE
jgi:hypothetical protein